MSMDPKKLKAHIGSIKAYLDEIPCKSSTDVTNTTLSKCFQLLLITELCQRGIIYRLPSLEQDDQTGWKSLLDVIQSTAGKIMLNESNVPKPLVAGAAVISSLVAEKIADILLLVPSEEESLNTSSLDFASIENNNNECQSVLKRCEDVGDTRFQQLLNLGRKSFLDEHCFDSSSASTEKSSTLTNAISNQSHTQVMKKQHIVAILYLRIAMGNILRATSFSNPDQPPMWKRSSDLCVKLNVTISKFAKQYSNKNNVVGVDGDDEDATSNNNDDIYGAYHTTDVTYPITNLIRIAESKNNTKRVSELSLRLVESYISHNGILNDDDGNNADGNATRNLNPLFSQKFTSLWKQTTEIFVQSNNNIPPTFYQDGKKNRLKNITNGRKILNKFDGGSVDSIRLKVLYQILCIRVEMEHEELIVQTLVKNRSAVAKNRTGIALASSSSSTIRQTSSNSSIVNNGSETTLYEEVKRDVLAKSLSEDEENDIIYDEYDDKKIDSATSFLQSTILSMNDTELEINIPKDMQDAMYDLFTQVIERSMHKAQALSLHLKSAKKGKAKCSQTDVKNAWNSVVLIVKPFLEKYNDVDTKSIITSSKKETLRKSALATFTSCWMKQNDSISQNVIDICTAILSEYLEEMKEMEKKEAEDLRKVGENLIQTTGRANNRSHKNLISWITLLGHCQSYLSKLSIEAMETTASCQNISGIVINSLTELHASAKHVQFGIAYYFFLSCWSGLHNAPWSFCNVTKARSIIRLARETLIVCEREWGRKVSELELVMIDLGEADAECGFLSGGFTDKAKRLYNDVLSKVGRIDGMRDIEPLICAHCISGLLMISFSGSCSSAEIVDDAMVYLNALYSLRQSNNTPTTFHKFTSMDSFQSSINFHLCQLRTLVAEIYIRLSEVHKAEEFLKSAVADSPSNFDAAFALGAFWLRMSFDKNIDDLKQNEYSKKGQIQLLKSLKLDSTKADPFSLLGLWYEKNKDFSRAIGCFSKALLIDPSHPVAGRGILRMRRGQEVIKVCNDAVSMTSNNNGWAWRTLGNLKALDDGLDEVAVACYQQALRCRDIENVEQHTLNVFFVASCDFGKKSNECSKTWAALASCYRRLGKFSASLRAYEFASESGESDEFICAWAQVELELGLLEDAALKFDQVLQSSSSNMSASFGSASCSLLLTNRNIEDGKFGVALNMLRKGIQTLSSFEEHNCTVLKLLGDLYSHGYKIPQAVYARIGLENHSNSVASMNLKRDFLEKGYFAYEKCLEKLEQASKPRDVTLTSTILSDMATNLMLQAQLILNIEHKIDDKAFLLLTRAKKHFCAAIELNDLDASLWCGLGCSLFHQDAILSQHAFCRALQLDSQYAEAWVNLGFCYAKFRKYNECETTIDVLTQVADTPLMWVLRGIVLEGTAAGVSEYVEKFQNASDAFRACVQTCRNQAALLGLASTCRRCGFKSTDDESQRAEEKTSYRECYQSLSLFLSSSDQENGLPHFLHKVMEIENGRDDVQCSVLNGLLQNVEHCDPNSSSTKPMDEVKLTLSLAQRNVHMNPDDGEGWLNLAKQMVVEFTNIKSPSEQQHKLLIDVIQRTNCILKGSVVEPVMTSATGNVQNKVVVRSVKATQLADAEVLSSLFQARECKKISSKHLQRALLLDPENRIARTEVS